jgi:hypothetical protein
MNLKILELLVVPGVVATHDFLSEEIVDPLGQESTQEP